MLITDATSLPRLMNCNGSRLMAGTVPAMDDDTSARDEGTAAHWLATQAINAPDYVETISEMIDRKAPNGVYITPEIAENVEWYVDEIKASFGRLHGLNGRAEIETTFESFNWRVNARADHIAYADKPTTEAATTLYVDDFKYGWTIVEPFMNWTLIAHACGYVMREAITPQLIVLTVHQPRPHHPDGKRREWRLTYQELLDLYAQIDATLSNPSDLLHTGDHCYKCPALGSCPAYHKSTMKAIDASETAFSDAINNGLLSVELDILRAAELRIKQRKQALEELATHRIKAGQVIENYTVETQLANRSWKDGVTPDFMKVLTGRDLAAKPKLITPRQAEQAGVDKETVKAFSERIPTGFKLNRVDANKKAQRIFNQQAKKG